MAAVLWSILTYVLLIGGFLLGIVLVAHILLQKRSPSGTIAWLLIIFFLPWVGVPLYLFFGGRKMRRHVEKKGSINLESEQSLDEAQACVIDRVIRSYDIPGAENGHAITLCTTGEDRFAAMLAMLADAKTSIFLSTFVYHDDAVGSAILDTLVAKAQAGVKVRLLMDGLGSLHTRAKFFRPLAEAGGQFAYFMPVLHRPFRGRTNLRNHRKITIVDNRLVMAGGANIGNDYMGPQSCETRWKDLAFTLEGPAVKHWLTMFARDWEFAAKETISADELQTPENGHCGSGVVQVVPAGPDVPSDALHDAMLSMVYAAQSRLWVVTPYFVPDDALCQALILAARRGVDVRILLPRRSNHRLPDIVRGNFLRQIQAAGGLVMFYTPRMLHSKALLMDDQVAVLGSANMDVRSLLLNYEVAMFVYSAADIAAVAEYIEEIAVQTQCGIGGASLSRALGESIIRLVSPLL